MRTLRAAAAVCLLAFGLTACAEVQNAYNIVTGQVVSPQTVIVAANAFDALKSTATNYLRLPKCTGTNAPACRDPVATAKIIPAIRAGTADRNQLEAAIKANPDQSLTLVAVYNDLQASISTLQTYIGASK
jgi:hypothetical protein